MNIIGLILGLGVLFVDAESFVAYDCNNAYSSYIKYDAVNLKKCSLDNDWIAKEEDVDIQVIQEKYEDTIEVHTCTVTKTIEIGKYFHIIICELCILINLNFMNYFRKMWLV